MIKKKEIPVFLFTGFLESGKTKFIQETLEDKRFCKGERTLLLVCEEGEEEYAPDQFADGKVYIRMLEREEDLNEHNLTRFMHETRADRVLIEYNGMWLLDGLYNAMPEGWIVYQEFFFADASTFISYNANMRQLVYDKLKSCELAVFNRFNGTMDKMEFHKIVRGASRRADIAYEYVGGKVEYDDIEDPLPFDLEADIIDVGDDDYAVWYRDMSEEPDKYENKTVRFKCNAVVHSKIPAGCFLVGRHMMTCCADDIQFAGLVCQWEKAAEVKNKSWMILTARINFKRHKAYAGKGPVLSFVDMEYCEAPEQPVAAF